MPRHDKTYIHQVMSAIAAVLAIYMIFIGFLYVSQRSMIYFPPSSISEDSLKDLEDFQTIGVTTSDGLDLTGYYSAPQPGKPIIVFFHGNASHPAWEAHKTDKLRQRGYGVLLATYRGYAGNPGKPTEEGLFRDGDAFLTWVTQRYKQNPVILYGTSLGSGVAVEMAVRHKPAALILEAPFESALSVAQSSYPYIPFLNLMMRDQYLSNLKIKNINVPVLFLLAGKDTVVTLESGERLYALASEPKIKEVFSESGHANIYDFGAEDAVIKFTERFFP